MLLRLDSISFHYRLNISGQSVKGLVVGFIGIGSKIRYQSVANSISPTALDQPEIIEEQPDEQEVTLRWRPSTGNVTEYRVEFIPSDGSQTITVPVDGRRNSVTVTGTLKQLQYTNWCGL